MYENKSLPLIGPQIRRLRTGRGLTLQDLAERAGTSASALHRYETGWDRFEIATLRRIATALGGRLEVRLLADDARSEFSKPSKREILRSVAPLFWDRRLRPADLADHALWVLCRVLMYGNLPQMQATRSYYGDELIRQAIAQRVVDTRTRGYWELILGLKDASQSTE